MSKILVIQNEEDRGLGFFEEEMRIAGVQWDLLKAYAGDPFPVSLGLVEADYRGLIVLGGSINPFDQAKHSFLKEELRLIRHALERKLPMLNIGLGALLLARVLDVPITLNGIKEVGFVSVNLIEWYAQRNPLFFQLPVQFTCFHWHQETFEIPTEGYRLARSELNPNQAFCYGGNAYGLMFHPEATDEMIREWIEKDGKAQHRFLTYKEKGQILSQISERIPTQKEVAHKIFYGFSSLLRPANYRRPL